MSKTYRIGGMTCGGCARAVESAIKAAAPDAQVSINLEFGRVTVDNADDKTVETAVAEAGFTYNGGA